jgi:hypothetical protein
MRLHPQQQALQSLPQTRMDWLAVPPPPPFLSLVSVHRHQQQQPQHYYNQSSDPGQGQRYGLKRSWNVMESA